MTFVSASPAASVAPAVGSGGLVQWVVAPANELAAGATTSFELIAKIEDASKAPYRNTSEISADSGDDDDSDPSDSSGTSDTIDDSDVSNDSDPNDADDSDFAIVEMEVSYDLALIKQQTAISSSPATLGTQVSYQITVMNQGTVASGSFTVDDVIPAGMSFVSATPVATTDPGVGSGGNVQWVVPGASELAAGAQTTFDVVVEITDVSLSPFRNEAAISADSGAAFGGDKDSDPDDNSGSTDTVDDTDVTNDQDPGDSDDSDFATLTVDSIYDLALIKNAVSISPMPASLGSVVTYEVTVMNQGNVGSGTFTVSDDIPPGMAFISASPAASSDPGVGTNGNVTWTVPAAGQLAAGAQKTFTLQVSITDATQAPYHNTAEIVADSGDDKDSDPTDGSALADSFDDGDVTNDNDPNDSDDSDFADITLTPEYDLALVKNFVSASPSPVETGSVVNFEITVMNQGNVPSGSFAVNDILPSALTFVSASPSPTTAPAVGSSGTINWVIPASAGLSPAGTMTLSVVAKVAGGHGTTVKNIADIVADDGGLYGGDQDSNPGDGSGSSDSFDDSDVTNDEDPNDEDDSDFALLEIPGKYDLALIKTLSATQGAWVSENEVVDFVITVKNQGEVPSGKFVVVDTIPGGMTYEFANGGPNFACTNNSPRAGRIRCVYTPPSAADLAPGQSININVGLKVTDASKAPFVNWAEIVSDSGDDIDSTSGSNSGASDTGEGDGSQGSDPTEDHNDIDHTGKSSDTDEDDSDPARVFQAETTPIRLQTFEAVDVDGAGTVEIRWTTSLEDGNAGFYLYARDTGGEWERIHPDIIPATAQSDDGASYAQQVNAGGKTEFAITDVDLFGAEVVHGPYALGQKFGTEVEAVDDIIPVDTDDSEAAVAMDSRKVYFKVTEPGIYRVTHEDLIAKGFDFGGQQLSTFALSHKLKPVPIRVQGKTDVDNPYASGTFGSGGFIEFVVKEFSSLYTKHNVYLLELDPVKAKRFEADYTDIPASTARASAWHNTTKSWAPNRQYSRSAPFRDPWYADKIVALKKTSKTYNLSLSDVVRSQPGVLRMRVWSLYDDPKVTNDHLVRVSINGQVIKQKRFRGISSTVIRATIPDRLLKSGVNQVTVELPMTHGVKLDQVYIDEIAIDYATRLAAQNGAARIRLTDASAVNVPNLSSADVSVYREDLNGMYMARKSVRASRDTFIARFGGAVGDATWHVADATGRKSATILGVPSEQGLLDGRANYLAIAHPSLMTAQLDRLLQQRQADGYTTKTVDVRKIYARYSGGIIDPLSIKAYLTDAAEQLGTEYVLLVGGDTYDPMNYLRRENPARSFVPTLYAETGQAVKHAPVDPLLGDIDNDGVPDLMIGRMAVQTKGQLKSVIDKTLIYPYASHGGKAVIVSDGKDDGSQRSFEKIANFAIRGLNSDWSKHHFAMEKLELGTARNRLISKLNDGVALTAYVGHSDRNIWSFDGVLTKSDVSRLTNNGNPTVVLQWGCWNTYYVDPDPTSMTYAWLLGKNRGAAAALGSTTLTEAGSEQALARKVFSGLSRGNTLGKSLNDAKRQMIELYGPASVRDLLGGFVILGDPTIVPLGR